MYWVYSQRQTILSILLWGEYDWHSEIQRDAGDLEFPRLEWEEVGGDHEKKYRLDQCLDPVVRGRWCNLEVRGEVGMEVDLRPGGGGGGG